jgi:hypothetical protein
MLALAACSPEGTNARVALAPPPPAFTPSDDMSDRAPSTISLNSTAAIIIAENQALAQSGEPGVPADCRLQDRFDRSAVWSLSSRDGQRKLALDVDTSGTSVDGAMLRYSFKLSKGRNLKDKTHCLYPSRVQGLAPSAYRELVKRKHNTVWQELRNLRADLLDR